MRHCSHSLTGIPEKLRIGIISRLQIQKGTAVTHKLESQMIDIISRVEVWQGTVATHQLESQGQASSAGLKGSNAL